MEVTGLLRVVQRHFYKILLLSSLLFWLAVPLGLLFAYNVAHQLPLCDKATLRGCSLPEQILRSTLGDQSVGPGTWALVAMAWLTFLAVGAATYQVMILAQQAQLERERWEREVYRSLLTPEMITAKRFVRSPKVRHEFEKLFQAMGAFNKQELPQYREIFENLRKRVNLLGQNAPAPLLGPNHICFEHIEQLINEYEYLSQLILEHRLRLSAATPAWRENCLEVYRIVRNLITLRRRLSGNPERSNYARSYESYATMSN